MNSNLSPPVIREKKPWLVFGSLFIWFILVIIIIWPWIHQIDPIQGYFTYFAHLSAAIWWIVLFWTLHNLVFQFLALFNKPATSSLDFNSLPSVAILYATCDDFNSECCLSCLNQDYSNYRILICDDSSPKSAYMNTIDNFCNEHLKKSGAHIRRPDTRGFKAGNLNHAIRENVIEDWILLVDADQFLPKDYLSKLIKSLPPEQIDLAFVQTSHEPVLDKSNPFQATMSQEIKLFFSRDLILRQTYGFMPILGHGTLINKKSWEKVKGFPEVVSEDFAFALRIAGIKQKGFYTENTFAYENYPVDFGGFMIRIKKFSGGTAELFRREILRFLSSSASFTEKWDLLMQLGWYFLMPAIVLNGYLSAYVVHTLWVENIPYLHPVLPYLYTLIFVNLFSVNLSVMRNFSSALKFYFWSTAIYTSALPLAGLSFLKHLFIKPTFERTPKNSEKTSINIIDKTIMLCLGILAIVLAFHWFSPFSPILIGQGIAYISYPFYNWIDNTKLKGIIGRCLVCLPGLFMLIGLIATWIWGRF